MNQRALLPTDLLRQCLLIRRQRRWPRNANHHRAAVRSTRRRSTRRCVAVAYVRGQIGVAMGNASQLVKDAADDTSSTNDEDGVAAGIDKYILVPCRNQATAAALG